MFLSGIVYSCMTLSDTYICLLVLSTKRVTLFIVPQSCLLIADYSQGLNNIYQQSIDTLYDCLLLTIGLYHRMLRHSRLRLTSIDKGRSVWI